MDEQTSSTHTLLFFKMEVSPEAGDVWRERHMDHGVSMYYSVHLSLSLTPTHALTPVPVASILGMGHGSWFYGPNYRQITEMKIVFLF